MPQPLRLDGLRAKVETTYGTDAVTTAGDAVRVSERLWSRVTVEHRWLNLREQAATGTLMPLPPAAARGRVATVEVFWETRGAGSAYSASNVPEADDLLRGCGLTRSIVTTAGSESVSYTPGNSGHSSVTLACYAGNKLITVVGARGTVRWIINPGEITTMQFTMRGLVTAAPAEAAVPAQTYDANVPPPAVATALTVGSWTPDWFSAEWELGANVTELVSGNAADGIHRYEIGRFEPRFTLGARTVALATYDPYAVSRARTNQTIDATIGNTQYNRIVLDVDNATLDNFTHAENEDFAAWNLPYRLTHSTIRFT